MTRTPGQPWEDIDAAVARCLAYRDHLDSEQLGSMAYDAILRNLAVIGEAVKALPEELKSARPEVPWASIAGLRNVVVHEYFRVDPEMIRDIVDHQLVVLVQRVEGSP